MSSILTIGNSGILSLESGIVSVGAAPPFNSPNDITGLTDHAWWDYSFAGAVAGQGGTWEDTAATIPCTNGNPMRRVDDRSGNGHHATQAVTSLLWKSSAINGLGAADHAASGNLLSDTVALAAAEWSLVIILQIDSTSITHTPLGGVGSGGPSGWHLSPFSGTGGRWLVRIGNTGGGGPSINENNEIYSNSVKGFIWFYFEFDQSTSRSFVDNVFANSGSAWNNDQGPGNVRIGSDGAGGNGYRKDILEVVLFDKKLSDDERTGLFNYHNDRYDLDNN